MMTRTSSWRRTRGTRCAGSRGHYKQATSWNKHMSVKRDIPTNCGREAESQNIVRIVGVDACREFCPNTKTCL